MPYPGWQAFKHNILELQSLLTGFINSVERFSVKYIDILPRSLGTPSSLLKLNLKVGPHDIRAEPFQIRVEIPKDGILHIVQLTSEVTAPWTLTQL